MPFIKLPKLPEKQLCLAPLPTPPLLLLLMLQFSNLTTPQPPYPQETAVVSTLLPPSMDLSMGWVMDNGIGRHYCCFEEQLDHVNYDTDGWVSGLDVEIRGSGHCHIGLTVCDGTTHTMVLSDVLLFPTLSSDPKIIPIVSLVSRRHVPKDGWFPLEVHTRTFSHTRPPTPLFH